DVAASQLPGAVASASVLPVDATTAPSVDPAATPSPTDAPTQAPGRTNPPRTAVPTQAPVPQTVNYSARLTNGTTVSFTGPGSVVQGTGYDGALSVRLSGGSAGTEPMTLYFGQLGIAQTLTLNPDRNGNFVFTLK